MTIGNDPIGGDGGGTPDNTTGTYLPIKRSGSFENSPLHQPEGPGTSIVSDVTIEVPPGTLQVGEGLKMSAAGVIPIFRSVLTEKKYIPTLFEYDGTGSMKPFSIVFGEEENLIVQPDFSQNVPLDGTFPITVSASEFINKIILRCTPNSTIPGMRIKITAQGTGGANYYFPSKSKWLDETGEDLPVGANGKFILDLEDAPLGLLVGSVLDIEYAASGGDIFGDGVTPYLEIVRQVGVFTDMVDEAPTDGKQYGRQSEAWTEIVHEGHYLGIFADIAALESAHPTANDGDTATVTSPTANLFFWNSTAWEDSGTGYVGDMLKAVYDPALVGGNVFDMGNMVEAASSKILTSTERTNITTNNGKVSFPEAPVDGESYVRKDNGWILGASLLEINDTNGYEISIDDSTQTVGEINVSDGVQTQITNNGLGANYSNLPSDVTEFVETPDGDALLDQEDGIYSISVRFNTRPATRDKAFIIEFIAENGGSPINIFSRSLRFTKDITTEEVSVSFTTPAIASIVNLPISVYITTTGTATDIWGQSLSVTKNNAPII